MFTALLDTCVLWPSLQRDFLLSLAIEGLYRPVWSAVILDELEHEEAAKLLDRGLAEREAARRARRLITQMRAAFTDAEVDGWEGLEGTFELPDPDDEHVLAAAVVAGAGAIVTHNLKDFPSNSLPDGLHALHPKIFARNTVALSPGRAWLAVEAIVARSGRQGVRLDGDAVLDRLESTYEMREAVELLRAAATP